MGLKGGIEVEGAVADAGGGAAVGRAEGARVAIDEQESVFECGGVGDEGFEAVHAGVHGAGDAAGVGRFAKERPSLEGLAEDDGERLFLRLFPFARGRSGGNEIQLADNRKAPGPELAQPVRFERNAMGLEIGADGGEVVPDEGRQEELVAQDAAPAYERTGYRRGGEAGEDGADEEGGEGLGGGVGVGLEGAKFDEARGGRCRRKDSRVYRR